MSKVWHNQDMENLKKQTNWYLQKTFEVSEKIEQEREATAMQKAQAEDEFLKIEKESNELVEQKRYIENSKKRLERSIQDEQKAKIQVLARVEDMKSRRLELESKLD